MNKEIQSILTQVIYLYLSASGPLFLFKSLRGLSSIQILSDKYSTKELMNIYSRKKANKEIDEMCLCYIIMVTLSFKPYEEANQYLKSLSKEKYIWAKELFELILCCYKSYQVENVFIKEKIKIEKVSVKKNTSTSQKIENTQINEPVVQQYPDSLKNVVADSATNITFEEIKDEN